MFTADVKPDQILQLCDVNPKNPRECLDSTCCLLNPGNRVSMGCAKIVPRPTTPPVVSTTTTLPLTPTTTLVSTIVTTTNSQPTISNPPNPQPTTSFIPIPTTVLVVVTTPVVLDGTTTVIEFLTPSVIIPTPSNTGAANISSGDQGISLPLLLSLIILGSVSVLVLAALVGFKLYSRKQRKRESYLLRTTVTLGPKHAPPLLKEQSDQTAFGNEFGGEQAQYYNSGDQYYYYDYPTAQDLNASFGGQTGLEQGSSSNAAANVGPSDLPNMNDSGLGPGQQVSSEITPQNLNNPNSTSGLSNITPHDVGNYSSNNTSTMIQPKDVGSANLGQPNSGQPGLNFGSTGIDHTKQINQNASGETDDLYNIVMNHFSRGLNADPSQQGGSSASSTQTPAGLQRALELRNWALKKDENHI